MQGLSKKTLDKKGGQKKINILQNIMAFHTDTIRWKIVKIFTKEENAKARFEIKTQKSWPEKGLFLWAPPNSGS